MLQAEAKKIMIVEDDLITMEQIKQGLANRGYRVIAAVTDGDGALGELERELPDLVLMDISIKGSIDGIALTKIINERYNLPVIYLTAYADKQTIDRAKLTGSYGYIAKPFSEPELIASIEIALYKQQLDNKLKRSEERYRTLFETMKDAIFLNTADGSLVDCNPALLVMYRYKTRDEALKKNVKDIFVDQNEPATFLSLIEKQGFVNDFETRHYRSDGSIMYCTISANAIKSEEGNAELIQGIIRDITNHKLAEEKLLKSEARYRLLAENSKDIIWTVDLDGRFTYMSPSVAVLTGFTAEEMLGKSLDEFILPRYLPLLKETIAKELRTPPEKRLQHITIEAQQYAKDGSTIDIEVTTSWIFNERGEPIGIQGSTRDIRERKKVERELRITLDATTDGIWSWNVDSGEVFFSDRYYTMLGYGPGEFPASYKSWIDLLHPDDRERVEGNMREYLTAMRDVYDNEFRLMAKDGSYRWIRARGRAVERGADGKIVRLVGNHEDVTSRTLVEQELRESEEKYRTLLENIEEGYYVVDLKGNFKQFNDSYCRMLGYTHEEMAGLNYRRYTDRETAQGLFKVFNYVYRTGKPAHEFSWQVIRKDGCRRDVEISVSLLKNSSGQPIGFYGISRDVTDRKRAEAVLRESEERYRLLAEHMRDVVWLMDIEKDRFLYVSPSVFQLRGFTPEEVMARPASEALTPGSRDNVARRLAEALDTGGGRAGDGVEKQYILEQPRKDGTTVWTEVVVDFVYDEGGAPAKVIGVSRDITRRKKTEDELERYREKLEDIVRERTAELEMKNDQLEKEISVRKRAEENVENEKLFMDMTINGLPGIFCVTDENGNIIRWNDNFELVTGYSAREIKELKMIDIIDCHRREEFVRSFDDLSGKGLSTLDTRILTRNGIVFPYLLSTYGMSIGGKDYIIWAGIDIIRQKVAEEELKRLSRSVEQSPASVVITDTDGAIEYVNPAFCRITGYSADEVIGENPRILKSGDKPGSFYKELWDTILSGKIWEGEFRNKKKNGEIFWESTHISPIVNDEGAIRNFVAVKIDITEKKLAEEALMLSKEEAERATRAKSEFLANMSHELRTPLNAIIGMNYLLKKTGLSPKQRGYIDKITVSSQNLLGIINDILDFSKIEAGKMELDAVVFSPADVIVNVSNIISEKAREKGLALTVNMGSDVPESLIGDPHRLEQVIVNLANNAVKFTDKGSIRIAAEAVAFHEGRVLLKVSVSDTGIGISKEQMNALFQPFRQADSSSTRRFEGTGLGLSISRRLVEMMGGEIGVESEPGVGSVFSFILSLKIAPDSKKYGRTVPDLLRGARALVIDDDSATRFLLQMFLKSFGFNTEGASSGDEAMRMIKDAAYSGRGYELMLVDRYMPGTDGIETARFMKEYSGLPDKPKIILVTGFEIEEKEIASIQTSIDRFLFKPVGKSQLFNAVMDVFGLENTEQGRTEGVAGPLPEGLDDIRGARLLLVEDNTINQEVACELLRAEGFRVSVATNGLEAMNKIKDSESSGGYDAVLMDLQMPEMDGYQATRLLREDRRFRDLPVIAMTAEAIVGVKEQVLAAGMNDYVTKPITPRLLFESLVRWIKPGERAPFYDVNARAGGIKVPPGLPESLPGINIKSGLDRMRGNDEKYRALLIKFSENHGGIVSEIRTALDEKDPDKAARLTHNLKGVSGNIGAGRLASAAQKLEAGIKDKRNLKRLLQTVERELDTVIVSINKIKHAAAVKTRVPIGGMPDMNKAAAMALSLMHLIETFDTRALDEFAVLKEILIGTPVREELHELERLLGRYEFTGAMALLDDIMKKLKFDGTTAASERSPQ
jgi:PAS domain S-box-containing protein